MCELDLGANLFYAFECAFKFGCDRQGGGGEREAVAEERVKALRPLIHILVIVDNHCGLTLLLRYKNRLVR
jgi:hypothetical protein